MKLSARTALVTGAASGIGQETALLFAGEGARLVLVDRDADGLVATVAAIEAAGGAAVSVAGDVGDPALASAAMAAVPAGWAPPTILMTAAGFSVGGTVLTTDPADWDAVMRVHVGGTWLFARAAIPAMQAAGGGSIITVASQLALAGGRGNSAYIAAKGAILSLTRTMALDFAADRIRVNAIAPGAIDTPMLRRSFARHADPAAAEDASVRRHALQRLGTPREVAEAALYLASDGAGFTTGTTLVVDGGWLAQ